MYLTLTSTNLLLTVLSLYNLSFLRFLQLVVYADTTWVRFRRYGFMGCSLVRLHETNGHLLVLYD
jgi:hypothetical protein